MRTRLLCLVLALGLGRVALAAESASHKLNEFVFNAGGHPSDGTVSTSASHRITLDAVGEGVVGGISSSASFKMDGGFVVAYPPPGEVTDVRFSNKTTLVWHPEKSVGTYNLYRDLIGTLPGGFGVCRFPPEILTESTTDSDVPASGTAYFYLVTAANRLAEEGTKGFRSSGPERGNPAPCPSLFSSCLVSRSRRSPRCRHPAS
jgi:hypothetical protein